MGKIIKYKRDMNTKEIYISPVIEIVEIEVEGVIAGSADLIDKDNDGVSYSKRHHFWGGDE